MTNRCTLIGLSLALLASPLARAQTATPTAPPTAAAPSAQALQTAQQLVDLVSRNTRSEMISSMTGQMWPAVESSLKAHYPNLDAAALTDLRRRSEQTVLDFVSDVMKQAPAIYARNFTVAEMRDIIAFYGTPTGAKALKAMPQISADNARLLAQRMPDLQQKTVAGLRDVLKAHGYPVQ